MTRNKDGKKSGSKKARNGQKKGYMATSPREWPDNAKEARDQAASRINNAKITLDSLLDGKPHTDTQMITLVAKAQSDMGDALRWLERYGATTTPRVIV